MTTQKISGWAVLLLLLAMVGCDQRVLVGTMDPGTGGVAGETVYGVGGAIGGYPGTGGGYPGTGGGYPGTGGVFPPGGTGGFQVGGNTGGGGNPSPNSNCAQISTVPGQVNLCGRTYGIAFSPDGTLLATGTQTRRPNVHIWRLSDGAHLLDIDGIGGATFDVAFSPDGRILAAVGESDGGGPLIGMVTGIAKLYDVASGALLRELPVNSGFYSDSVAFSNDGTLVATAGTSTAVEVWRVSDASLVTRIPYPTSVHNVHFAPTGSQIILGGVDERATVWNIPSGTLALTLNGIAGEMADAAFSPAGGQIASTGAENNLIKIWDVATGTLQETLFGHTTYVSHVVWVDQNRFLTDDWSGVVFSWSRNPSGTFYRSGSWSTGAQSLGIAVSPDKTRFAVGGGAQSVEGFVFLAL